MWTLLQLKKSNFNLASSAALQETSVQQLHQVQFDLRRTSNVRNEKSEQVKSKSSSPS